MENVKEKPVCFLCEAEVEEGDGKNLSEYIEGEENWAHYECLAKAAINEYMGAHKKKSLLSKRNWGFWVLVGALATWAILHFIFEVL